MTTVASCPKCAGRMEEGFTVDRGHGNHPRRQGWVRGDPVRSWLGAGILRVRGKEISDVTTLRCTSCGYLESYARAT